MIGILGGMGTQAGLDFCNKLAVLNRGRIDQEYPLFLLYNKSNIPGRPESIGSQTKNLSIIFISANNKFNVDKLKSTLFAKSNRIVKKISTGKLNACLKRSSFEKPHPLIKGKSVKFKYAVQISTSPFTIKIFSNFSKEIKKNYKTYLVNNFIKTFKIVDTKVNLIFSSAKNPFN